MKLHIGIVALAVVFLAGSKATGFSQENFSKEQIRQFKEADYFLDITDYRSALKIYNQLYPADSLHPELNYKIGLCVFNIGKEKLESEKYFNVASNRGHTEAHFYLARCYHLQEKFNEAIKRYHKYKNSEGYKTLSNAEVDRYIDISLRAKAMIRNPLDVTIENIGRAINSKYHDYVPLIAADESFLIFTSRREGSTGGKLDPYNKYFEDAYISYKENGHWTEPQNMGTNINTETHDACVGLSSNGNMLIIYRTNEELTGGDLYWSALEGDAWAKPVKFGPHINTEYQEPSASITADAITMYFSSNRPGGYGGKDIYRVIRFGNGDWSLPLNLGPTINTPFDDDAPFVHPDGNTLYFSSMGHGTIGGYDIFKSAQDEDGTWSQPENLGYPVNTVDDDLYFVISADGRRGYYSSGMEGGYGGQDIYLLNMPELSKVLTVVKGFIASADSTATPVKAKITLIDDESRTVQGVYRSNAVTGKYIMIFSPKKRYKMLVEAEGYYTHTERIVFTSQHAFTEIRKHIILEPKNEQPEQLLEYIYSYTLEDVYYDTKKHILLPESYEVFSSLLKAMKMNPKMRIEIAGHTDNVGDEESNIELSQKRADSVKDYLLGLGIEERRLAARGYGESSPVVSNDTKMGRAINRRTEIRVIEE